MIGQKFVSIKIPGNRRDATLSQQIEQGFCSCILLHQQCSVCHVLHAAIKLNVSIGERERKKNVQGSSWKSNPTTSQMLDSWQRSGSKSAYNSHAKGISRLQLSSSISHHWIHLEIPSGDGTAGLGWIDCTGKLPEQILSQAKLTSSCSVYIESLHIELKLAKSH